MRTLLLIIAITILLDSCTGTFYVVRHANRLNDSDDTPLSDLGLERARVLRDTLLNKGIDSIFVSTKLRTQQTGQPLATALRKTMRIYNSDTLISFVNRISKIKKSILVVSHSEQIPVVIRGLCNQEIEPIGPGDFDNMYIVTIKKNWLGTTTKTLRTTRYGRITP
jgi:broad specificity phosphatase PhoE